MSSVTVDAETTTPHVEVESAETKDVEIVAIGYDLKIEVRDEW